jgi:hypothetical protein
LLGNAISSQAIGAYFATEGCLTDATAPITSPTSSNDMGKTARDGIATFFVVPSWFVLCELIAASLSRRDRFPEKSLAEARSPQRNTKE